MDTCEVIACVFYQLIRNEVPLIKLMVMKTMSVGDFKANFSEAPKSVHKTAGKKEKRKIGILESKGKVKFATDFKITEEGFLNL
jgi:hypothetical protein